MNEANTPGAQSAPQARRFPQERQFFFAPVVLPAYNRHTGCSFTVGAASRKVAGMAAGVRSQGAAAIIVSAPIVTASRTRRYFRGFACRDEGLACVYLPALSLRGLNRLFAALRYLFFAMRQVRPGDGVVLYNYFPEYLFAAAFLRWRLGRDKVVMDLEDGPRADERTWLGYLSRFSLRLLTRLCSRRAIVVSRQLATLMQIEQACVVHGICADAGPQRAGFGMPVRFLYGGSIETDTGLELFAAALRILARAHASLAPRIHIIVTGFGGATVLRDLSRELAATGLKLDVRQNIGPQAYQRILANADVGLSLKLPNSTMGATTFPSKVIEYAGQGLLVLATDSSDIGQLFDGDTAAILPCAEPAALAGLLGAIAADPARYQRIAAAGQRRIVEQCGRRLVGRRLVDFLGTGPAALPGAAEAHAS